LPKQKKWLCEGHEMGPIPKGASQGWEVSCLKQPIDADRKAKLQHSG